MIDASGTWTCPTRSARRAAGGGRAELADRIHYGIPDVLGATRALRRPAGAGVGSGHSAFNALLDLAALAPGAGDGDLGAPRRGTRPHLRRPENDRLPAAARSARLRRLVEAGAFEMVARFRTTRARRDPSGSARRQGASVVADELWWRPASGRTSPAERAAARSRRGVEAPARWRR